MLARDVAGPPKEVAVVVGGEVSQRTLSGTIERYPHMTHAHRG